MRGLTEAFLAGETDNDAERRLYAYYAGGDVAPDLERYVPMFGWYAAGMGSTPKPEAGRRRLLSPAVQRWCGGIAAASVIAVASLGISHLSAPATGIDQYSGSYVTRGGQRITDIETIMPELLDAERMADEAIEAHTAMLSDIDRHLNSPDHLLTDGITDPAAIRLLTDGI